MADTAMNYDPNLVLCGRRAVQTVRLTFGVWDYRAVIEVEVGGDQRRLLVGQDMPFPEVAFHVGDEVDEPLVAVDAAEDELALDDRDDPRVGEAGYGHAVLNLNLGVVRYLPVVPVMRFSPPHGLDLEETAVVGEAVWCVLLPRPRPGPLKT